MSFVQISNVTKSFGHYAAVKGISLDVADGEFLVLLGPSGCGKSTLMRMIAGIETVTTGAIRIDGKDVTDLSPKDRNVAMVFQTYALYPHLTVRANIEFPLRKMKLDRKRIEERTLWAARMFRIEQHLDRKPKQLSGGERQRVALARALVRSPSVFMMDEPLSNLDAKLRATARQEIQQFQAETKATTIYVTHDQVEAMSLGHRIAVLSDGMVRQVGTPDEIYNRPADTFVATFVGSPAMNIVPRGNVLEGFRPEQLLHPGLVGEKVATREVNIIVRRVEKLGSTQLVYGTLDGADNVQIVADVPAMAGGKFVIGELQAFRVPLREIHSFDKSTGKRLESSAAAAA
ncbi:ABC transporter ATP-binding protein [Rhizobium ecuadorense]|uniref:ABC transporter ATP-binding protein n=1 Tax=Rhizobium ecuadorense TaxID=1671795 RepID=UPI0006735978|nr:ABC transporter ATP-binding protein [Rhizobium ecuadorense]